MHTDTVELSPRFAIPSRISHRYSAKRSGSSDVGKWPIPDMTASVAPGR